MLGVKKSYLTRDKKRLYLLSTTGFIRLNNLDDQPGLSSRDSLTRPFRALDIQEDLYGRLLVGTPVGLREFKNNTLLPSPIKHPTLESRVEEIDEFRDGRLVFGTKGLGVLIWDGNTFINIGEREGLTSSMIEQLHIDSTGRLWVGTLNGLNTITFNEDGNYNIKRFTIANGLPSNEIRDIKSRNDQVWVATTKGLVQLPAETGKEEIANPPIIEKVRINGTAHSPDSMSRLGFQDNNIQIQFLTLDFSQNGRINYRYRLQPSQQWNNTQQRVVDYATLPPGAYIFEIQSQNKDGLWSEPTRLNFYIRPPFWRQIWFWILMVLALAGIIYRFYRIRVNRYKKEAAYQKEMAEKEKMMNELQRSALRSQMNPHFLSNCMNTIQGFIAKGEKMTAMRYLSSFNRLLRKALDFSQVDQISLEEEIDLLKEYIELEKMRFGDRFVYTLELDKKLPVFDTMVPPMLVQPFVENAILHAFPEEIRRPEIHIEFQKIEAGLSIIIRDNGIGITESRKRKAGSGPSKRKSYGMRLPARRLKLMSNGQEKEPVTFEEIIGQDGKVRGTKVHIRIISHPENY